MSNPDTFARVVAVLKPYAKNAKALADVTPESRIREDLMVNSARLVDVVLELETQFDIQISDADADAVETVGDAIRIVESKRAS